jgi:hypothetical protein
VDTSQVGGQAAEQPRLSFLFRPALRLLRAARLAQDALLVAGENFPDGAPVACHIRGQAASAALRLSASEVRCALPADLVGAVAVHVSAEGFEDSNTLAFEAADRALLLASLRPASVPTTAAGGARVQITGANFLAVAPIEVPPPPLSLPY